jgi:hypothetical protein
VAAATLAAVTRADEDEGAVTDDMIKLRGAAVSGKKRLLLVAGQLLCNIFHLVL